MTNIELNEDKEQDLSSYASYNSYGQKPTGLVGMIIKFGLAKNKQDANKILMVIGIVAIILMIGIFVFGGENENTIERNIDPITGNEIIPGQVPGEI